MIVSKKCYFKADCRINIPTGWVYCPKNPCWFKTKKKCIFFYFLDQTATKEMPTAPSEKKKFKLKYTSPCDDRERNPPLLSLLVGSPSLLLGWTITSTIISNQKNIINRFEAERVAEKSFFPPLCVGDVHYIPEEEEEEKNRGGLKTLYSLLLLLVAEKRWDAQKREGMEALQVKKEGVARRKLWVTCCCCCTLEREICGSSPPPLLSEFGDQTPKSWELHRAHKVLGRSFFSWRGATLDIA